MKRWNATTTAATPLKGLNCSFSTVSKTFKSTERAIDSGYAMQPVVVMKCFINPSEIVDTTSLSDNISVHYWSQNGIELRKLKSEPELLEHTSKRSLTGGQTYKSERRLHTPCGTTIRISSLILSSGAPPLSLSPPTLMVFH
jgi:hypothetical protein